MSSRTELKLAVRREISDRLIRANSLTEHIANGGERGFDFYQLPPIVRMYLADWVPGATRPILEADLRALERPDADVDDLAARYLPQSGQEVAS